jgi:N-acetylneuraminic acid mutarotase
VNGKIYALGGTTDGRVVFSTVEEYDPTTDTWTEKTSMPTPRALFASSAVAGKIYAIGGWIPRGNIGKAFTTVEVYDPVTNTWSKRANTPTARWGLSTSVVRGKIYAIGGTTTTQSKWRTVSTVEVYNPTTDRWTKEANMLTRRGWHASSAVFGKIYVIGGASRCISGKWPPTDALSTVEAIDTGFAISAKGKLPTLWGRLKVW